MARPVYIIGGIVDSQWAGLDSAQMGLGPAHAATPILRRHGLGLNDLDAWEINEAFAAQVLGCIAAWQDAAYCKEQLGLDAPPRTLACPWARTNSPTQWGWTFASPPGRVAPPRARAAGQPVEVPKKLEQLAAAGNLGKKSGRGYYAWRDGKAVKGTPGAVTGELIERLVAPYLREAQPAVAEGIVADADLADAGLIFGTGFAPFRGGPLNYLKNRAARAAQDAGGIRSDSPFRGIRIAGGGYQLARPSTVPALRAAAAAAIF